MTPPPEGASRAGLREPLAAFFAVTGFASGFYWLAQLWSPAGQVLHVAIAIAFLYVPAAAARLSRRPFDYRAAGLRLDPIRAGLVALAAAVAIAWPLFMLGFFVYYGVVCAGSSATGLTPLAEALAPVCVRWRGLTGGSLQLPPELLSSLLTQILVIAVPEELFFRGYLQSRCEERWPSTRRLLGAPVGRALLASSALFALGHFLVDFVPQRLAVFVPALVFGWLRARTGSIAAGAVIHALSNVLSDVLHRSYFG